MVLAVAKLPSFLPGMGFKEKARQWREQYFSLAEEGHRMVKEEIVRLLACAGPTTQVLYVSPAQADVVYRQKAPLARP